jgi:hypothetical protein
MKNLVLILSTILVQTFAQGQSNVYHPFPDSNAVWTEQAQGFGVSDCPPPPSPNPVLDDYSFSYFMQSDTLININSYHKIYQSGTIHSHCAFGNFTNNWSVIQKTYSGAYRQDTLLKKVFFVYPSASQECVLYDFSLNPGDTLKGGCQSGTIVISSIDSVLTGKNYRKRFNLSTSPYSIIEGIGSTSGLLEPLFPFEYTGTLICFVQNMLTLYPDTITTCEIVTPVNEIKNTSSFTISPNPFMFQSSIISNVLLNDATIILYNSFGQKVKQMNTINGQIITLLRDNLPAGLYFIRIIQDNKTLRTDKLLITDN